MTATTSSSGPQPIPADAPLTFRAGHATIELHRVVDGFSVVTIQGTKRVDEWSCSYRDERTARDEARRAARAFCHFRTAQALAAEYDRLSAAIDANIERRNADGDQQARELEAKRADIEPFRGFHGRQTRADLIDRWTASRDLMLAIQHLPQEQRLDILDAARDSYDATHVQPGPVPRRTRTLADLKREFAATHPSI